VKNLPQALGVTSGRYREPTNPVPALSAERAGQTQGEPTWAS
jgi:hypothetical protein